MSLPPKGAKCSTVSAGEPVSSRSSGPPLRAVHAASSPRSIATHRSPTRAFSDRLEEAIARYHTNAVTTAEVIQELIKLAKDIRAAHQRGEEEGLSQEEISFYDALAQNESAVEVMGNDQLLVIAQEMLNRLKSNPSVDWQHRESARMRILVKRILRKYGYPPDLQDAAVQTVLQQAEVPHEHRRIRAPVCRRTRSHLQGDDP